MIIAITGRPGVGKSTVFNKVINELKSRGYTFYGFYCPEVREGGIRIGFKIIDIYSGESGWLALALNKAVELGYKVTGKRIGKYVVIEEEASRIGVNALRRVVSGTPILGIDEIGPMELSIPVLRSEIIRSLSDTKKALLVLHMNLHDNDILNILKNRNAKVYTVTEGNRNSLPTTLINILLSKSLL